MNKLHAVRSLDDALRAPFHTLMAIGYRFDDNAADLVADPEADVSASLGVTLRDLEEAMEQLAELRLRLLGSGLL